MKLTAAVVIFGILFLIFVSRDSEAFGANWQLPRKGQNGLRAINEDQMSPNPRRSSLCTVARNLNCDDKLRDKRAEDLFP